MNLGHIKRIVDIRETEGKYCILRNTWITLYLKKFVKHFFDMNVLIVFSFLMTEE